VPTVENRYVFGRPDLTYRQEPRCWVPQDTGTSSPYTRPSLSLSDLSSQSVCILVSSILKSSLGRRHTERHAPYRDTPVLTKHRCLQQRHSSKRFPSVGHSDHAGSAAVVGAAARCCIVSLFHPGRGLSLRPSSPTRPPGVYRLETRSVGEMQADVEEDSRLRRPRGALCHGRRVSINE